MPDIEQLKTIPLFRNFSEAMLKEFSGFFKHTVYSSGEVIFREKAPGSSLFIIVAGEVVIEKAMDEEGREFKTLAVLAGGDFFGEMALIDGAARFAQARSSADTVVYEVSRQEFFSFIKDHPETGIGVINEIMRTVFRRLQHTSSELTMLFDLSRLRVTPHKSPAGFFAVLMDEMRIYLEGSWNMKGYAYNMFNEEYEEVYSRASFPRAGEARALPVRPETGWLDESSYMMVCSVENRQLACAVFESAAKPSPVEKNNLATIFNTISSIAGSAMINIEHQVEAAMLEKLRNQRNSI